MKNLSRKIRDIKVSLINLRLKYAYLFSYDEMNVMTTDYVYDQ